VGGCSLNVGYLDTQSLRYPHKSASFLRTLNQLQPSKDTVRSKPALCCQCRHPRRYLIKSAGVPCCIDALLVENDNMALFRSSSECMSVVRQGNYQITTTTFMDQCVTAYANLILNLTRRAERKAAPEFYRPGINYGR
jgi:hypothetical protein